MSERASYHHGDLRRAVLDASLALIASDGLGALSMREVARRAKVSHGAPYHHFADRGAIVAALAEEGFARLEASLRAAVERAPAHATARFEAAGRAYVLFAAAHAAHFRIMFRPELIKPEEHPEIDVAAAAAYRVLGECIAACQAEGVAPAGDPAPLVLTAWATAHGIASLWLDGPLSRSDAARAGAEALAAGVASTFSALLAAGGRRP